MTKPAKKCKASALHSKNCYCNSCWCTTTTRAVSYSTKRCKASALHSKNCYCNSCWCTTTARAVSYSTKKCKASALHSKNYFSNSWSLIIIIRTDSHHIKRGFSAPFLIILFDQFLNSVPHSGPSHCGCLQYIHNIPVLQSWQRYPYNK